MIFSHEELDAYRLSELEQREHAKRHLTVVRAQMEELYKQVGGIMHELMEDEFYYESVKKRDTLKRHEFMSWLREIRKKEK